MQGPVGFRCRECGRPAYDPLTSMRPGQVAIALALAVAGGAVVGVISTRIGIFGLLLAWLAGGVIADAVMRFVGIKRGPLMAGTLFGGIVIGAAAAIVLDAVALSGAGGDGMLAGYLYSQGPWAALAAGITCFGAWSRLRF